MSVKPIPDDYPVLSPYLCVDDAAAAIDFYVAVFGAVERLRIPGPGGKIGHAELQLGSSLIMLADEFPEIDALGPKTIGGSPVTLSVYVEDVDATFTRAVAAGATALRAVENQFYGDRSGMLRDPFGHHWSVSSHVEDVSPEHTSCSDAPPRPWVAADAGRSGAQESAPRLDLQAESFPVRRELLVQRVLIHADHVGRVAEPPVSGRSGCGAWRR